VSDHDFPPVRLLGPADLKNLTVLATDRGWLPEKRKWGLLLETSEIFGADAPDGNGLAGSVTLTRYGTGHASVGMMLVAARYGRRGLGQTLLTHLLEAAGDATVTLFATSMGRPLYEKLGFKATGRSASFTGRFRPGAEEPAIETRPATNSDLPAILALDREVFGADRSHIVRRLPGFAEKIIFSLTPRGTSSPQRISGYAAAWSNGQTTVIGPVIAPDDATARGLITDLAAPARGPVRLDVDPGRAELPAWLHSRGLEPSNLNTVMAYGPWDPPGDRRSIYAPITVALT
jgi:ribosomal protein S18 acetylase RimI-like enzyme